MLTIYSIKTTR